MTLLTSELKVGGESGYLSLVIMELCEIFNSIDKYIYALIGATVESFLQLKCIPFKVFLAKWFFSASSKFNRFQLISGILECKTHQEFFINHKYFRRHGIYSIVNNKLLVQ